MTGRAAIKASRVEVGYNKGWAESNPQLFTKSIFSTIEELGFDEYDFSIRRAYMPGESIQLVATRKEI